MGVAAGSPVSAANTNQAFIDANADDSTVGRLGLNNALAESGSSITNTQRELNAHASFMGVNLNQVKDILPAWTNNDVGSFSDTLKTRADLLTQKFNDTAGHKHTGAAGDAPAIEGVDIANVPLHGYIQRGIDITGATGTSTDVSSTLIGEVPSSVSTVQGIVVNLPYNKCIIQDEFGNDILDGLGNEVYGRIEEVLGVWTLYYYSDVAGVETAYSFAVATDLRWYYQKLYNPVFNAPVYSEFAFIPSDNATEDVLDASPTQRGVVNTGTQAFAGAKTFNTSVALDAETANRATYLDASKVVRSSTTTSTELGYLSGTTSSVQTQLNSKLSYTKYTIGHAALQAASLTNNIELFSLPAKGLICGVIIIPTVQFAGTGITSYFVSVGIASDLSKYSDAFDVSQAITTDLGQTAQVLGFENVSSATSIRIAATATGANLDQSTAGSVDVFVLWTQLT